MAERLFLGRYRVVRLLAEGGMGRVYLARQTDRDRQVVVKVLHDGLAADAPYREGFRQEIQFLARFRHPYVVELYEASLDDPKNPCAVMEYVDGLALDELLARDGRFSPARAGRLLGQLCAVLQAAHDQGIIHRDLKPANLMVAAPGTSEECLKVLDFGLARQARAPTNGLYIPVEKFAGEHAHKAVGTPEYTCPEQFRGDEVDHRGDLYSVGVLLYELLTGRRPFQGDRHTTLIDAHLYEPPPPLAGTDGVVRVPPGLQAVVHACLAKDPAERPQSARDLALLYGRALGLHIWDERKAKALPASPADGLAARGGPGSGGGLVYQFEGWMPEQVAAIKLRGFVDGRGEVTESRPGFLRLQLRRPRPARATAGRSSGIFARLGIGKKPEPAPDFDPVDLDVFMERPDAAQPNKVLLTVRVRLPREAYADLTSWQAWCDRVQGDLGAYLMAKKL